MSCCPPSCAIPSCQPCGSPCGYPTGGLGSLGCGPCSSYPTGGLGSLCCGPNSSCSPSGCGGATSARCLGLTSGACVSCINQIPPSEIVIQPPPCTVVVPGAVLAASCEPLRVGGYTSCASGPSCGRICGSPC